LPNRMRVAPPRQAPQQRWSACVSSRTCASKRPRRSSP
jgi:hypothetical protein